MRLIYRIFLEVVDESLQYLNHRCVRALLCSPATPLVWLYGTVRYGTTCMYVCMGITYSKSKDRPGKVASPACGQLNRENEYFPVPVRA